MVKSGKHWLDKWKAKLSGDTRKQRYDSQKTFMVTQEAKATRDLVRIEEEVKILAQGEPIIYIPYYIIFGKEIYSKQKRFKAQTLINELGILDDKWEARGLDATLLNKIKRFYVPNYPPIVISNPFTFDVSLLNGPDVLV